MTYTKNPQWVDGEAGGTPVTAEKLNRIENGLSKVSPAFLVPSLPNSGTRNSWGAHCNMSSTLARGTSYPSPAGVPIAGIAFNITIATVTGTTVSVGVYDCDEIGQPANRLNLTTGIALGIGWKKVLFTATPVGGLLWAFFVLSQTDSTVRQNGWNNNSVSPFVPINATNWEAQSASYVSSALSDPASGFGTDTGWGYQGGFNILFNGVRS